MSSAWFYFQSVEEYERVGITRSKAVSAPSTRCSKTPPPGARPCGAAAARWRGSRGRRCAAPPQKWPPPPPPSPPRRRGPSTADPAPRRRAPPAGSGRRGRLRRRMRCARSARTKPRRPPAARPTRAPPRVPRTAAAAGGGTAGRRGPGAATAARPGDAARSRVSAPSRERRRPQRPHHQLQLPRRRGARRAPLRRALRRDHSLVVAAQFRLLPGIRMRVRLGRSHDGRWAWRGGGPHREEARIFPPRSRPGPSSSSNASSSVSSVSASSSSDTDGRASEADGKPSRRRPAPPSGALSRINEAALASTTTAVSAGGSGAGEAKAVARGCSLFPPCGISEATNDSVTAAAIRRKPAARSVVVKKIGGQPRSTNVRGVAVSRQGAAMPRQARMRRPGRVREAGQGCKPNGENRGAHLLRLPLSQNSDRFLVQPQESSTRDGTQQNNKLGNIFTGLFSPIFYP